VPVFFYNFYILKKTRVVLCEQAAIILKSRNIILLNFLEQKMYCRTLLLERQGTSPLDCDVKLSSGMIFSCGDGVTCRRLHQLPHAAPLPRALVVDVETLEVSTFATRACAAAYAHTAPRPCALFVWIKNIYPNFVYCGAFGNTAFTSPLPLQPSVANPVDVVAVTVPCTAQTNPAVLPLLTKAE
jgi:hypothetical protein